jgi:O-antigen ligase
MRSATPSYAFVATICGVIIEYGRPQDLIEALAMIRPGLILSVKLKIFAAIVALMACWVPFARNNYAAFVVLQTSAQQLLFLFCVATFVDTPTRLRRFMTSWVVVLVYQAGYGIAHGGVGEGFMHDENDFSLVMNMALPFAVLDFGSRRGFVPRAVGWIAASVFLAAVVVSMSRGGFVGLVAVTGTMVLFGKRRALMAALIACAALASFQFIPTEYWDEMRTISEQEEDATAQERFYHWRVARRVWMDHPIVGVGQGNINWSFGHYQQMGEYKVSLAGRAVHSFYFTLLPELGLVGVFLYAWLLWSTLRSLLYLIRSSGRDPSKAEYGGYARAIVCAFAAFLACGVFITVTYYPHIPYLVAMTVASRVVHDRLVRREAHAALAGQPPASRA